MSLTTIDRTTLQYKGEILGLDLEHQCVHEHSMEQELQLLSLNKEGRYEFYSRQKNGQEINVLA
jgi:hypothetical protein